MSKRSLKAKRRYEANRWRYKRHVFTPVRWDNPHFWRKEAEQMASREMKDSATGINLRYGKMDARRRQRLSMSKTRVFWERYLRLKGIPYLKATNVLVEEINGIKTVFLRKVNTSTFPWTFEYFQEGEAHARVECHSRNCDYEYEAIQYFNALRKGN